MPSALIQRFTSLTPGRDERPDGLLFTLAALPAKGFLSGQICCFFGNSECRSIEAESVSTFIAN